jgi:(p)ppGpp synthase/HD superfamily hydrolase
MDTFPPRLVMSMPLHAITEMYGEVGLRQRFALELETFDRAQRVRLDEALGLAAELHRLDRRSREPYLNHLLRTTIRIITYYEVTDDDVLVAALLHDAVEDHAEELAGARLGDPVYAGDPTGAALAELAERFNPRVAQLVRAVTNPPREPGRDRYEQYREHVAASLEANPWARVIKVSDFTDNGVGLMHSLPAKYEPLATKYRPLVPVLRELIGRPDTPLSDRVKAHIVEQLDAAQDRFDAILG